MVIRKRKILVMLYFLWGATDGTISLWRYHITPARLAASTFSSGKSAVLWARYM